MIRFLLLIMLVSSAASAQTNPQQSLIPDKPTIKAMFREQMPLACLPFAAEPAVKLKCEQSSVAALESAPINYKDFTLGALKVIANRTDQNGSRSYIAKRVLMALGERW